MWQKGKIKPIGIQFHIATNSEEIYIYCIYMYMVISVGRVTTPTKKHKLQRNVHFNEEKEKYPERT